MVTIREIARKIDVRTAFCASAGAGVKNTDSEVTRAFLGEGVLELGLDYLG